jgi:hypothetical protein
MGCAFNKPVLVIANDKRSIVEYLANNVQLIKKSNYDIHFHLVSYPKGL